MLPAIIKLTWWGRVKCWFGIHTWRRLSHSSVVPDDVIDCCDYCNRFRFHPKEG